jgi:hypothetical protein
MLNEAKRCENISTSERRTPVILQYKMEVTGRLVKPVNWPFNLEKLTFG